MRAWEPTVLHNGHGTKSIIGVHRSRVGHSLNLRKYSDSAFRFADSCTKFKRFASTSKCPGLRIQQLASGTYDSLVLKLISDYLTRRELRSHHKLDESPGLLNHQSSEPSHLLRRILEFLARKRYTAGTWARLKWDRVLRQRFYLNWWCKCSHFSKNFFEELQEVYSSWPV